MLNNVGGNGSPYPYASLFQYGRLNPGSSTDPGSASSGQSTDGLGGLLSNSSATSSTQPQGSSSDVASAFQQFDSSIQSFLVQLQSALGNTTTGQTTTASTGAPTTTASTSGAQTAAVDGDGDNDGSPASTSATASGTSTSATGQATGHHHHHHHGGGSATSQAANGTDPSSAVQNDLNNLVSDLSTLLNANGSSTGATGTTTAASGTSTGGTSSTSADADSATGSTASNTSAQSFASTLAQDLLRALQSYGPGAQPANPTQNPSVIQPSSTVA